MRLADPWVLLLMLMPAGLLLRRWWLARTNPPLERIALPTLRFLAGTAPTRRVRWRSLPLVAGSLGLGLVCLALARPQLVGEIKNEHTHSRNIMIVLDISSSMKSPDFQPGNRLALARGIISRFVRHRQGDLLGLVIFSGKAFLQAPLGPDTEILGQIIDQVELGSLPDGTAIGTALTLGLSQLKDLPPKASAVILVTDGANNTGEPTPLAAAEAARALGIKIYAVGLSAIDTTTHKDGYIWRMGREGDRLLASDEAILRRLTARTGGEYFRATDSEILTSIMNKIDPLERTDVEIAQLHDYHELYSYFLIPGLLLLVLQSALSATWLRSQG
ncbi:MAG: VWA domain-containing protein [Gemmatimonadota bacterium]